MTVRVQIPDETLEEYLEAIHTLSKMRSPVRTTELSRHLSISPASATEMVQRLSEMGYLKYRKYRGVELTREGEQLARQTKRRHRLVETMLVDLLGMDPGDPQVHEVACKMEHTLTPEVEELICTVLGHPRYCPNGHREIPACNRGGEDPGADERGGCMVLLSEMGESETGVIKAIIARPGDEDLKDHISVSSEVVVESSEGDHLTVVTGGVRLDLARSLADRIIVQRS